MHQKNIRSIMQQLERWGMFSTPRWSARLLRDGVLELEFYRSDNSIENCIEMTLETFEQDFLPKQPNFVRMQVTVSVSVEASMFILDHVEECDYLEYAMGHKQNLFDENSTRKLTDVYDDIIRVEKIL